MPNGFDRFQAAMQRAATATPMSPLMRMSQITPLMQMTAQLRAAATQKQAAQQNVGPSGPGFGNRLLNAITGPTGGAALTQAGLRLLGNRGHEGPGLGRALIEGRFAAEQQRDELLKRAQQQKFAEAYAARLGVDPQLVMSAIASGNLEALNEMISREDTQRFVSSERQAGQEFETTERLGTQDFQGEQRQLDRLLTQQGQQLSANTRLTTAQIAAATARRGQDIQVALEAGRISREQAEAQIAAAEQRSGVLRLTTGMETLLDEGVKIGPTHSAVRALTRRIPGFGDAQEAMQAQFDSYGRQLALKFLQSFKGPTTDFEYGVAQKIAGGADYTEQEMRALINAVKIGKTDSGAMLDFGAVQPFTSAPGALGAPGAAVDYFPGF